MAKDHGENVGKSAVHHGDEPTICREQIESVLPRHQDACTDAWLRQVVIELLLLRAELIELRALLPKCPKRNASGETVAVIPPQTAAALDMQGIFGTRRKPCEHMSTTAPATLPETDDRHVIFSTIVEQM